MYYSIRRQIYDMYTTVSYGRSMICVLQYQMADLCVYYSIRWQIYDMYTTVSNGRSMICVLQY